MTTTEREAPMQTMTDTLAFTELDYRESHGIQVSLLWNPDHENLTVSVSDSAHQ
jgi:hypothetical protein